MNEEEKDIKAIFWKAVECASHEEQLAYLEKVCGSDAKARAHVEELLRAHEEAGDFLEAPSLVLGIPLDGASISEGPGTVIGRYKLLEKIGEGGMAVVYMAEQQEPIRRNVALKIIKLGMDTKQVIARFEAERQALAMMDHPNIAKVLDAGATETGRPYFVMELVTGVSITEYCDQNNLSTKDRLALFVQVCNAVQHAHTKGIIHRDIKPSNVMVTHHDGKPVPKVIDFGIAKATNQRLTEKTLFTRYAHIIGTPAYMSPEQAELSDVGVDTRTDIYSLGVLLYELLTGTTPFSEEELRKAGYLEMQKVIREQEPAKPSTKLTSLGATLTDVAKHRSCTPDLLRKAVRGDLDWIVMKSLEKDRLRRYETADALWMDVQRHLDHRPVLARAPSEMYRLHRFLRRHRAVAIGSLVTVVVVGGVIVSLCVWSRHQAQVAEAEAIKQANILTQARNLIASSDYAAARGILRPLIRSKHVGLDARDVFAKALVDGRDPDEDAREVNTIMEKHYRERIKYYTERIAVSPEDPNNYLRRAGQFYYLGRQDETNDDMARYATIVTKGAFAGFRFSRPKNLGPVINTSAHDFPLWLSSDGLSLWFQRTTSDVSRRCETFVATRATKDAPWGSPVSLGLGVAANTKGLQNSEETVSTTASLSLYADPASMFKTVGVVPGITTDDGREMYFSAFAPGDGYVSLDLWVMKRETMADSWSHPEPLGPPVNSPAGEVSPTISPNGLELYFGSTTAAPRPGTIGLSDLWVTRRATRNDPWDTPANLGRTVNTPYRDHFPVLLGGGLLLFFYSDRPGGYGQRDLYVTKRKSVDDQWCPPVNLGPSVNSAGFENGVYMLADATALFFNSNRPGGYGSQDIWEVQLLGPGGDAALDEHTGSSEKPGESGTGKEVTAEHDR